jgi:hypothetical protein
MDFLERKIHTIQHSKCQQLALSLIYVFKEEEITIIGLRVVWWDGECDRLNDAKLVAFREFRKNGTFIKIT